MQVLEKKLEKAAYMSEDNRFFKNPAPPLGVSVSIANLRDWYNFALKFSMLLK